MKPSSDNNARSKAWKYLKAHVSVFLFAGGVLLFCTGIYIGGGWLKYVFWIPAGICFFIGRLISYLEKAGPD
jgi:hypothetical protein